MTGTIAIVGNTKLNIGIAMAGDLALAGHDVTFFLWPDQGETYEAVVECGGIQMRDPADHTLSGRTGVGRPRRVTTELTAAVAGADLVVMDVAAPELERRFAELLPHLRNDQIVHVNTHGYWPSLRVAGALRETGKTGVTLTEGIAPTIAAGRDGATVTPHVLRRNILAGVFPAERTARAMARLGTIFHSLEPARNVLHTNLGSMNFLIHPGIALVNVGYFDRAEARGESISFYGTGNTIHAGRLAEALDLERPNVHAAFDIPYRPLRDQIVRLYGTQGRDLVEVVAGTPFYRDLPPLPATIWRDWMRADVSLAHVPFVRLAEQVGAAVPVHRGFVDIMDALLGTDSWADGLTLEKLGLADLSVDAMLRYVEAGELS